LALANASAATKPVRYIKLANQHQLYIILYTWQVKFFMLFI